jgi:hypothetical protein
VTFRAPRAGNGEQVTDAGERQAWLEHLIDVCRGAAADLERARDAHHHSRLIRDIHELRKRLETELAAL